MLNTQDMFDWFANSAAGQALVSEKEAEHIATREQLAEQLASIRADHLEVVTAQEKTIAAAKAELLKRQDAAAAALAKLRQTRVDRHNAQFQFDREVQQLERELRETADNETIDAFIRELQDESNELCRERNFDSETETRTIRGNPTIIVVASNMPSIRRRLAAIGAACEAAEQLRLSASKDIASELQKLRDNLPAVTMEKV